MNDIVWRYNSKYSNSINTDFWFNVGSHFTPLDKIAIDINLDGNFVNVAFKREDLNTFGSFKDRSLSYWISYYLERDEREFVISSSGNAAISAAGYINIVNKNLNVGAKLTIYVSHKIRPDKLVRLVEACNDSPNITINKCERPKSDAIKYSTDNGVINLRSSTDDIAIEGYKSLIYEIFDQFTNVNFDSIFICCSSGTSTVGFYEALKESNIAKLPAFHIVQTTKIHPIAKEFNKVVDITKTSLVSAVTDRVAHRKNRVVDIVRKTGGHGWILNDDEIIAGMKKLERTFKKNNIEYKTISPEMGLVFKTLQKASEVNEIEKPLCIMSGL